MNSETISHYRILSKLGAGGMGEVYLAEDTRLGRQVALKFLPASYQYDPDRRAQFLKDTRIASGLRSPNIAAIYDIGEHQDTTFIVREYVEGEMLSRRLDRGPLPVPEALDIAIQIADALDEVHRLGFVHSNIKTSNLIITDRGLVKILDFGLLRADGNDLDTNDHDRTGVFSQQTSLSVIAGEVSYLSPEQTLGHDIDHRSDIFSLGVVLYEMLTGRPPFEAESSSAVIDRILHHDPQPIARLNYSVPPELERIVRKCLEKDRSRRYQSAQEIAIDLRNLQRDSATGGLSPADTSPSPKPTRKIRSRKTIDSLAILPLINESLDPDTEYLTDGITESIINNLSQLPRLRVMARSTVFRYKGRHVDATDVGRTLDVRAVLTGRVLQRADRLLIRVELVDTLDGSRLWGEQYNREMRDIFTIEEEISREISEKLRLRMTGAQKKQLRKRHTENTEAYQLYLKGRYHWNKRLEESLAKGIEYFERAISTDPNYALAYAGLADSYNLLAGYSALLPREAFPIAKAAALKALELDDKLAEAHTSLAYVKCWYEWDWGGAERAFKKAISLNPGYAIAHLWYSLYLVAMERMEEAMAEVERAKELDPLSLIINLNLARMHYFAREYDEAIALCQKTIDLYPGFALAYRRLGQVYAQKHMYNEAIETFHKGLSLAETDTDTMAALGHAYAMSGNRAAAEKVIEELNSVSGHLYISAYSMARVYMGLGDHDQTLYWLEKSYEERYGILAYLRVEPIFDDLRRDPRFEDLLRRIFSPSNSGIRVADFK